MGLAHNVLTTGILSFIRRQATRLLTLTSLDLSGVGESQQQHAIAQMATHPDTNHAQRCFSDPLGIGASNMLSLAAGSSGYLLGIEPGTFPYIHHWCLVFIAVSNYLVTHPDTNHAQR
ncbi:hypothetical protein M8J77_011776 [Diaphorina citri]|nr:hypothetical protein M8J77_017034 [Diaphorina citri]KAI5747165.1 hypothetical protein M8J77_011776 [Diaphorina citri]